MVAVITLTVARLRTHIPKRARSYIHFVADTIRVHTHDRRRQPCNLCCIAPIITKLREIPSVFRRRCTISLARYDFDVLLAPIVLVNSCRKQPSVLEFLLGFRWAGCSREHQSVPGRIHRNQRSTNDEPQRYLDEEARRASGRSSGRSPLSSARAIVVLAHRDWPPPRLHG